MNKDILQNRELSKVRKFQVYYPEEINSDTKIIYYEHGSGGYPDEYDVLNNRLSETGSNAIIIECERFDDIDQLEILRIVSEETGVPITNINTVGHSMGAKQTMITMAEVIQENPNMEPQTIMLLDGSWQSKPNNDVLNTLGSNGTTIFTAIGVNGYLLPHYEDWSKTYGINMVIIDGDYEKVPYHERHKYVNESYVNDNLLDFQSGAGTFPYEYTAKIFDGEEWIEIDIGGMTLDEAQAHISLQYENIYYSKEGINNINLLSSLGTIKRTNSIVSLSNLSISDLSVLSDSDLLAYYINQLSSSIKTTSFIQNLPNFTSSYNGNTSVPTELPLYMNGYFSATTELLLKLSNDLNSISKIGYSIDIMEQSITKEVEKINTTTM